MDDPDEATSEQMDGWTEAFDNWAICDTACFHLFDRTPFAWDKAREWATSPHKFVRRASYATVWALSLHNKKAEDMKLIEALRWIEEAEPDSRPLVNKGADMALRAVGKRNPALNQAAIAVARRMADSQDRSRAWIGRHALRELESERCGTGFHGKERGRGRDTPRAHCAHDLSPSPADHEAKVRTRLRSIRGTSDVVVVELP